MYKVDVSINWWDQSGRTLAKQHMLYQDVFRWKFPADLACKIMTRMGNLFMSERKEVLLLISSVLKKDGTIKVIPLRGVVLIGEEVYKPELVAGICKVKSKDAFKQVWAPTLSLD